MSGSTDPRTIPTPRLGSLDPDSIIEAFGSRMTYQLARDHYNATAFDEFQALAFAVRDRMTERWFATQRTYYQVDAKRVYYLSLEFLLGRMLLSNILSLGALEQYSEAMRRLGRSLEKVAEAESDAGLGNGGLGRLAACFLDSAATLSLPFFGYGIRYEFGIFWQRIVGGEQTEAPDQWLRYGNPWEVPRPDVLFPVRFYGRTEESASETGEKRKHWVGTQDLYAMAYDMLIPGYRTNTVNSLRLWAAKSSREFDLAKFNAGQYVAAVEDKYVSENISKVLYPADDQYVGRELRLKQQYFFTSATIQDVIRRFKKRAGRRQEELARTAQGWDALPEKVAIQLNDTHPAIAIPELMRVLVDLEGVSWDAAWSICQRVFAYTNHTVLPEALEAWPRDLIGRLLPRHLEIIEDIDRRFRASVAQTFPGDERRLRQTAIIDDSAGHIRMANLAIIGSHAVNGVAQLHAEILRTRVFPDFHQLFPQKFTTKTNGITPRRWLLQSNPQLSALITEAIGDGWARDLDQLRKLEAFAADEGFRQRWAKANHERKIILAARLRQQCSIEVDPDTLFDVQIKRIHEYKRQLLNVLHVVALFHRIRSGETSGPSRTVIIGGKAAPSYRMAKAIIALIHHVAAMVRAEPLVAQRLRVEFVPNYGVSMAEVLFPATDLSEQISTAGTEASGTGNMKAILNGAIIIGTLDGATIEIRQEVGPENVFIFGHTAEQIAAMRQGGYAPHTWIERSEELKRVIETIATLDGGRFQEIAGMLVSSDYYFHCADFASYVETQQQAGRVWQDRESWTRMSILNTARSGRFSSDRTIAEYAREIWQAEPVPVSL